MTAFIRLEVEGWWEFALPVMHHHLLEGAVILEYRAFTVKLRFQSLQALKERDLAACHLCPHTLRVPGRGKRIIAHLR